jgi:hypothetical protein
LHFRHTAGFRASEEFAYNGYADRLKLSGHEERPIVPIFPATQIVMLADASARQQELFALLLVVAVAVFCAIAVLVLLRGLIAARGTTLVAPLAWALVSLVVLFLAATLLHEAKDSASAARFEKWWLIAASSTFCPLIALLGAKRPQDRAWQMIVLSFWGIIALPAIQSLMTHPAETLDLHLLWEAFFVVLILMGWMNYASSPFGLAGTAVLLGQTLLFWRWLPLLGTYAFWWPGLGVFLLCIAVMVAGVLATTRRRLLESVGAATGWNRVWLDFRDWYGLLWTRRVMQRVEEQASTSIEWIDWYSLRTAAAQERLPPNEEKKVDDGDAIAPVGTWSAAEPALRSLLRRFVSNKWIERRLHGELLSTAASSARSGSEKHVLD